MMDWKENGLSQAGIAKNFTNHKGGYKDSNRKGDLKDHIQAQVGIRKEYRQSQNEIRRNRSKPMLELERI